MKLAQTLELDFPPGTHWSYSNTGYVLLGILIRKVTGQFYGDFLEERIFSPLGMETARVISEADIVKNRAAGYVLNDDKLKNQEWVSPSLNTTADGSLYLSVLDYARWDAGLGAGRLLKKESYDVMWSPVRLADGTTYPYGFGWRLDVQRGDRVIAHGGSWQGFQTAIARYPERKLIRDRPRQPRRGRARARRDGGGRNGGAGPRPARHAIERGRPRARPHGGAARGARGLVARPFLVANGPRASKPGEERSRKPSAGDDGEAPRAGSELAYLAEDDFSARSLERRGEPLRTVVYCALRGKEGDRRYRFFLNEQAQVTDFDSETAD